MKKEAGKRVDEAFKPAGAAHMLISIPLVGKQIYGVPVSTDVTLHRLESKVFQVCHLRDSNLQNAISKGLLVSPLMEY